MQHDLKTVSVIIITLNRPDCVRRCLAALAQQDRQVSQVMVVDASTDARTRDVVAKFPGVQYLRNDNGFGRMMASRNVGLLHATGDIIAFVDDDAYAEPQWLAELIKTYDEGGPSVGAVGGRVIGDGADAAAGIGMIRANGTIAGNFGADPGRTIEVDHVMGCNMSFRREVLAKLGGFREDYPGISGIREDTDMLLRVGAAGYKVLFNPRAAVEHVAAPQARGSRFDTRYAFYAARNHTVLLIRNYGVTSGRLWRFFAHMAIGSSVGMLRGIAKSIGRASVEFAGIALGLVGGIARGGKSGPSVARVDVATKLSAKETR